MGRASRVFVADGVYHVVSRGSNREPLYRFDGDRLAFLDRFACVVEKYELDCLALVLMTNHYHGIVRTPDSRLSDALRDLHGGYSRLCSRVYGRDAHLFRNRFGAHLIDGEAYLLTGLRYVHMNPWRAGLCGHPSAWPWSTYLATIGREPAPAYLALDTLFGLLGLIRPWDKSGTACSWRRRSLRCEASSSARSSREGPSAWRTRRDLGTPPPLTAYGV